jgi:hypothetical protein
MRFVRKTAKYTWRDHNTNEKILNIVKVTSILDKITSFKSDWIQHVKRMPRYHHHHHHYWLYSPCKDLGCLTYRGFVILLRHCRTRLDKWSARRKGFYPHRTTQETNFHALSRIRTHDPVNQAAADLRLRLRGHWDRRMPRSKLPNLLTKCAPRGIRSQWRPLKRLLDEWDWNRPEVAYFPEREMMMFQN